MNLELLTTDQLRTRVEKTWIEHIKLCQDNFLYFIKEVWPEFIYRKAAKPSEWGHHQIIANEYTNCAYWDHKFDTGLSDCYEAAAQNIEICT